MSVVDGGSTSNLIQRVQDILLRPKPTWDKIDAEPATVRGLYVGYICILAAIGPICGFLSSTLLGGAGFGLFALVGAIVGYVLTLAMVYFMALVVDGLAPGFGGAKNQIQAFKVLTYGLTAAWVAGLLNLIPLMGGLLAALVSLYSVYLLYLGLPKLMKTSEDKALVYTLVTVVIYVVIAVVVTMVVGMVAVMGAAGAIGAAAVSSAAYQ